MSEPARGRAAGQFEVSERAVTTILVNKRDLPRDQLVTAGD